jgi:hypothetical protein
MEENEIAIWMANKALDVPNADPDDELRTISRQFLRRVEELESLRSELSKKDEEIKQLNEALKEILPIGFEMVATLINGNLLKRSHEQTMSILVEYKASIDKARKLLEK